MFKLTVIILLGFCAVYDYVSGHGMVLDPVSRSSRWRYTNKARPNYDDTALWCGGFSVFWDQNNGKCGYCGDSYSDPQPRKNEDGGYYGNGVVVADYKSGGKLPVGVFITANHRGYFYFTLCNLDIYGKESDLCFSNYLRMTNGEYYYQVLSDNVGWFNMTLEIPPGTTCNRCVLQWTYNAGNSWGVCANGGQGMGCGKQENFRTCSDIRITK